MTEPVPDTSVPTDVFVVPYDRQRGGRVNSTGTTLMIISAVLSTVLALGIAIAMWWGTLQGDATLPYVMLAGLVTGLVVAIAWFAWRPVRVMVRNRRNLAAVADALRISPAGVGFPEPDKGGWIEVPWSGIVGARVATWRNIKFLHIALAPDLRADHPGVRGADDPKVWRTLTRPTMGMIGPRFSLGVLQRSTTEIDAALRRYSGGRIGLS